MSVLANSERLQDGFALTPPPAKAGDQHPFASHDITKEDWEKFLNDLQKVAHMPLSQRLFSGNFIANRPTSQSVQFRMSEKNVQHVGDYLLAYNQYFFHPRRISVVLAMGRQRYSGETDEIPPDLRVPGKSGKSDKDKGKSKKKSGSASESDTDSSDSEDDKHGRGHTRREDRMARKEERRERREKRRDERKERKEKRSGAGKKHDKHDSVEVYVPDNRFRLVICFWDGSREVI